MHEWKTDIELKWIKNEWMNEWMNDDYLVERMNEERINK